MARPQGCAKLVQAMVGHGRNRHDYDMLLRQYSTEARERLMRSQTPIRIWPDTVEASRYLCRILQYRAALYRGYSALGQTDRRIRHHAEHSFSRVTLWSVQEAVLLARNHQR